MRKGIVLLLTLVALGAMLVAGCAGDAPAPTTPTSPTSPTTPTTPSQPAAQVIKWQYQGHPPVADYYHQAVVRIADHITTMSNGRLAVEPFAGGSIVPATQELEGVHQGILQMGSACPMYNLGKFPQSALFDMVSGGMTAVQMFMWHTRGNGDELAARMWEDKMNVKYVGVAGFLPPEVWAHSNKKIETAADIKGLKMRCAGDGGEILASMGASTVFFPGGELYESMQRGVIDAFEYASPFLNWGMGFHEVAEYMYMSPSRAPTDVAHVWVNENEWNKLTPDLQLIVYDAVATVGWDYFCESIVKDDEALVQYLDYGTKVLPLPAAVEEAFLDASVVFYDKKAAADPFYKEIVDAHWEFKALCDRAGIK